MFLKVKSKEGGNNVRPVSKVKKRGADDSDEEDFKVFLSPILVPFWALKCAVWCCSSFSVSLTEFSMNLLRRRRK